MSADCCLTIIKDRDHIEQSIGMCRLMVMTPTLSYDIITPAGVVEHGPKY